MYVIDTVYVHSIKHILGMSVDIELECVILFDFFILEVCKVVFGVPVRD